MAVKLERHSMQPNRGKASICDYCSNQATEEAAAGSDTPCNMILIEENLLTREEPSLLRFVGDYEYCSKYEALPLGRMLETTSEIFLKPGGCKDEDVAKELSIHLSASYVKHWYSMVQEESSDEEKAYFREEATSWENVISHAQGGDWESMETQIDNEAKIRKFVTTYIGMDGYSIDDGWEKHSEALRLLAALLPSEE